MNIKDLFHHDRMSFLLVELVRHVNTLNKVINKNIASVLKEHETESLIQSIKIQALKNERHARFINLFKAQVQCQ